MKRINGKKNIQIAKQARKRSVRLFEMRGQLEQMDGLRQSWLRPGPPSPPFVLCRFVVGGGLVQLIPLLFSQRS